MEHINRLVKPGVKNVAEGAVMCRCLTNTHTHAHAHTHTHTRTRTHTESGKGEKTWPWCGPGACAVPNGLNHSVCIPFSASLDSLQRTCSTSYNPKPRRLQTPQYPAAGQRSTCSTWVAPTAAECGQRSGNRPRFPPVLGARSTQLGDPEGFVKAFLWCVMFFVIIHIFFYIFVLST